MRGLNRGPSITAKRRRILASLLLVLALTGGSGAQERLGFFACGEIRFFEACPPPPALPAPPPPAEKAPTPKETSLPEPLFTPETVAPTTPPVVLRLLQEPTEANAQAFLAWQQARLQRMIEVQVLLKRLQPEAAPPAPAAVTP